MTYPPQQPGQGGWGQQPAGNGHTSPQQQQPNWYGNQHTGWGQQGREQGRPGQPQPGQPQPGQPLPPQWGSEHGPGSWLREPEGFGDVEPPAPQKSKLPLVVGVVAAVLVLVGAGVGVYTWVGSGPGEPRPVAQEVVAKVNAGDFGTVGELFCEANRTQLDAAMAQLSQWKFDVDLGDVTRTGDKASAELSGTYEAGGASQPVDQTMGLVVEKGEWKVCDLGQ
ncbi:hypothetical protein EIL87_07360 [Saccharopolyspora rhizosphaerae]|uniref:DUF4878 domain-containing protein n=1 Tax=Saccharopolyspora rhizosphaerae TaxID=2492662 RepID=A0A3R8P778_9PSEU|nr:hypothetical protein [Saccharopolyspora rhizosphaerae]RRO18070.1 hypothetical protein EIL87_07360 [Saccharopolyspora rhizosphaerae]